MMSFAKIPKIFLLSSVRATTLALAFSSLALSSFPSFASLAHADACSVWPDRILRVNSDGASSLVFLLHTRTPPGVAAISEVGGRFIKHDPTGYCRPGNTSATCRDVEKWVDLRAIVVPNPSGVREDSFTFFLGSKAAPFQFEGVFYVQYADGGRQWLRNPTDASGNFWFTQESTQSLPQTATWEFDFSVVPRTAAIGHWSNPSRCED